MIKAYLRTRFGHLHYRVAGAGAPVVLLHPSPMSGLAMVPIAKALSDQYQTFCFDTPGYGQSEALAHPAQSLDDYVNALLAGWDALGIARCALIGAATGAQIAIEISKRFPERVSLLIADSACHFSDLERERILRGYFPDLTPTDHAGHLALAWQMSRDLFLAFPWFDPSPAARLKRDIPPPQVINAMVLDYMRAGPDYARAYRLAFQNERASQLKALRVQTLIPLWESSILKPHTEALLAQPLPSVVSALPIGTGPAARIEAIARAVRKHYRDGKMGEASAALPTKFGYLTLPFGQLHWRGDLNGNGLPVIALHDLSGSSEQMAGVIEPLLGQRPVLALDLPGNGDSDLAAEPLSTAGQANQLALALKHLGVNALACWGRYAGAQVALELAKNPHFDLVELVHLGALVASPDAKAVLLEHDSPSLAAAADGSHLLRAWHRVRDEAFFWPWFARSAASALLNAQAPTAKDLTTRVRLLLAMGERHHDAYQCAQRYPTLAEIANFPARRQIFATRQGDALADAILATGKRLGCRTALLPNEMNAWAAAIAGAS